MSKGIPNPGVLTPGGEWPTHPAPASTQSAKPRFLSTELNWKRIWKGVRWPILAMIILYGCGFSIEVGPSMNHLGWIYITKWGSLPTQSGQIIRLAPADLPWWRKYVLGSQVKRFTGRQGNLYGYEGDNADWSADNRDGLKPVPADHIAGVVVAAISPKRILNSFTAEGKFENWISWNYPPKEVFRQNGYVAVDHEVVHVWGANYRQINGGWKVECWNNDTQLKLSKPVEAFLKAYALYDASNNQLLLNRDLDGSPILSPDVTKAFSWGEVHGPLVYAMDENRATTWAVTPANGRTSESWILFNEQTSGTLRLNGGGDAATMVYIEADGVRISSAYAQWSLVVPFKAKKIRIWFDRNEPNSSTGLKDATIEGLSAQAPGPFFFDIIVHDEEMDLCFNNGCCHCFDDIFIFYF